MSQAVQRLGGNFSVKAFIRGLVAGGVLLIVLIAWLFFEAPATVRDQQSHLSFITVPVEQGAPKAAIKLENLTEPQTAPDTSGTPAAKIPVVAAIPEAAVPKTTALLPAPIVGLTETTAAGRLPVINAKTGQTSFQAYRRPFDLASANGKPVISLVVTDLGLSQAAAQAALQYLPADVSFAVSPYASDANKLIAEGRAKGHESWMVLPMQTPDSARGDQGPYTMIANAPPAENAQKLTWLMSRATGYVGFMGSADTSFMDATDDVKTMLATLYGRGLGFTDPSAQAMGGPTSPDHPYTHVDLWLDSSVSRDAIDDKLSLLEGIASKNGHAVGVLQPLPLSYQEIKAWVDTLQKKGYVLAPLSAQAGL